MKKKTIGLFGCGVWGQKILRTLIQINVDVVVFDTLELHRKTAINLGAKEYINNTTLTAQTFSKIDGIIVATPSTNHYQILSEIVKKTSIPLFIEKPLTTNVSDAESLLTLGHPDIFMMHIWEYHPGIQMLGNIFSTKELGEPLQIRSERYNWTSPRLDTDTLWNFMPHDLSIFKTILGELPTPKFASAEKHDGRIRDMTVLFDSKPICTSHISNRYERKSRQIRLHCSNGIAILRDESVNHLELIHGDDKSDSFTTERRSFISISPLQLELTQFITYLDGGSPPISDLADGLQAIKLIKKIELMI